MDSKLRGKFEAYPEAARSQLLKIREAIYEVAEEESLGDVTESLKWNEPSYQSKNGGSFRMDWKERSPMTISEKLPMRELKSCISMSLRYKEIKHLPLLGA